MRYNALGTTDMKVSHVSVGGAAFSNIYGTFDEAKGVELIRETLRCGVNYLETSPWYGQGSSERTMGKALKGLPRSSYYIGSKVGRYDLETERMFDFSTERTEAAVDCTLARLDLEYVDLIQIHDLSFAPDTSVILKETLPALSRAVSAGKARYIGLADYDPQLMQELVEESETSIATVLSYSKSTLFDNRLQNYTSFFKSQGVGVINAAATGMGLLCSHGPQPWHPATDGTKALCKQAAEYCKSQNVELARLATWFSLSQPGIDTNICGFYDLDQMRDTLDVEQHGLTDHEKVVLGEVQTRFFSNGPMHWDDVELRVYREKLLKLQRNVQC